MSLVSTYLAYKLINLLATPFKKWEAYNKGLIDDKGNILKKPVAADEKKAFGIFEKIIRKLKVIMSKFIGNTKIASVLATLYLIRDEVIIKKVLDVLEEMDNDIREYMIEYRKNKFSLKKRFLTEQKGDDILAKGTYRITENDPDGEFKSGDKFTLKKDVKADTHIAGMPIFIVSIGKKKIHIVKGLIKKEK